LTYACLFLLPWQTRWIFHESVLLGQTFEYGKLSIYLVEVLLLFAWLVRGKILLPTQIKNLILNKWAILFFISLFFSLIFSVAPLISLVFLFHLFFAILILFLLLDERLSFNTILLSFVLGLVIPSFLGIFQTVTGTSPASTLFGLSIKEAIATGISVIEAGGVRLLRAYGSFPHPNIFGGYLAIGLLFLFFLFLKTTRQRLKIILVLLTIILASSLFLTFSRSAWLVFILGLIVMFFLNLSERKYLIRKTWSFFLSGFLVILSLVFIFYPFITTRLEGQSRLEQKSIEERFGGYQMFYQILSKYPLFGTGPGAYTLALAKEQPDLPAWSYQPVHNSFILFLAETGIISSLVLFLFILSFFKNRQVFRIKQLTFVLPMIIFIFTLSLFDHYLWSLWPGIGLLAVLLGFCFKLLLSIDKK